MIPGHATAEGTARYAARPGAHLVPEHFRRWTGRDLQVSSIGIGTYLGRDDAATDALYRQAVARALDRGLNVIDTAVNYRHQRSERAIGVALSSLFEAGTLLRDEVVVATKGGFLPFDGAVPRDASAYLTETYVAPGIVRAHDLVAGSHCMSPRYLVDQLERSRANLGLDTIDVYYVHNPETQLGEVDRPEFGRRLRAAFAALEQAVRDGKIRCYGTATWNGYRGDPASPDYLSLQELVEAARDAGGAAHHFEVIQVPYNLAMPEAMTRANQPVKGELLSLLEAARRLDIYVMASASVYQGQLTRRLPPVVSEYLPGLATDAQRALQFVRSTPGIGTALVGMKTAAHVDENADLARRPPLPWAELQRLFSEAP